MLRTGKADGRAKRAEEPESREQRMARLGWYWRMKMPVLVAHRAGEELPDDELTLVLDAQNAGAEVIFLEWTDEMVERV